MNNSFVLQYLAEACRALKDSKLPDPAKVYLPNEPIPAAALQDNIYYEVNVGGSALLHETETASLSSAVGSIVISGKINVGAALINAAAEALIAKFAPHNPSRSVGFVSTSVGKEYRARAYIIKVERSENGTFENRYRTTIFVTFEIHEEKRWRM